MARGLRLAALLLRESGRLRLVPGSPAEVTG